MIVSDGLPKTPAREAAIAWGGRYNPDEGEFIRGYEDAASGRDASPTDEPFAETAYSAGFGAGLLV